MKYSYTKHDFLRSILRLSIFMSVSCTSIYIPTTPNIPLCTETEEAKISLGLNTNSAVLNGSYAVTDKYAILGAYNISYGNFSDIDDLGVLFGSGEFPIIGDPTKPFKHWILDVGFGRYYQISSTGVFEVYSGVGYGISKDLWSDLQTENRYGQIYIQSNIGLKKAHFELGGVFKLSGAYFNYQYQDNNHNVMYSNIPVLSIQYGGILRVGGEKVNFWFSPSLNYCHSFIHKPNDELGVGFLDNHYYTTGNLTFGISYSF
jgi:hypothetical protein